MSTIEKQSLKIIIMNSSSVVLVIQRWTCELCKELDVPAELARRHSSVRVTATDDWSTPSRHANELFVHARMFSGDNRWRLAPAYDDGRYACIQQRREQSRTLNAMIIEQVIQTANVFCASGLGW